MLWWICRCILDVLQCMCQSRESRISRTTSTGVFGDMAKRAKGHLKAKDCELISQELTHAPSKVVRKMPIDLNLSND